MKLRGVVLIKSKALSLALAFVIVVILAGLLAYIPFYFQRLDEHRWNMATMQVTPDNRTESPPHHAPRAAVATVASQRSRRRSSALLIGPNGTKRTGRMPQYPRVICFIS